MTVDEIADGLSSFVNDLGVAHLLATRGIDMVRAEAEEVITHAAELGNTNPIMHAGIGFPGSSGWAPHLRRPVKELRADLTPGGAVLNLLGCMWIVTLYTTWDTRFRRLLAEATSRSSRDIRWHAMGDLRRLRNDVVHHRGIATKAESGKCEILTWALPDQPISVTPLRTARFSDLTADRVRRWRQGDFGA